MSEPPDPPAPPVLPDPEQPDATAHDAAAHDAAAPDAEPTVTATTSDAEPPVTPVTIPARLTELAAQIRTIDPDIDDTEVDRLATTLLELEDTRRATLDEWRRIDVAGVPSTNPVVDVEAALVDKRAYLRDWHRRANEEDDTYLNTVMGQAATARLDHARTYRELLTKKRRLAHPLLPVLAIVAYPVWLLFFGSPSALHLYPWGDVIAPVGMCGMEAHPGLDVFLLLGWAVLIAAIVLANRQPHWASNLASAAVALGTLAASLGGAHWYEMTALGGYQDDAYWEGKNCEKIPTEILLASLDERLLVRATILILAAASALIALQIRALLPEWLENRQPSSAWHEGQERRLRIAKISYAIVIPMQFGIMWFHISVSNRSGDIRGLPLAWLIELALAVSMSSLYPGWLSRRIGHTVIAIGVGVAFGQFATMVSVRQEHLLGAVTRDGARITVSKDVTAYELHTAWLVASFYVLAMAGFAVFWALSRWGEPRVEHSAAQEDTRSGEPAS